MNILTGLLVGIFAVLILLALAPSLAEQVAPLKGSNVFNCPGYIDTATGAYTYNASLSGNTNTFGCGIVNLIVPLLILGVIIAIILIILYGRSQQEVVMMPSY